MTALLLKLHRWLAILFALPLAVVIVTGLILSFEPSLTVGSLKPGTVTVAKVEALIAQHDPEGKARSLSYRTYDNTLVIGGGRGNPGIAIDASTGEKKSPTSALSALMMSSRFVHEHLIFDMSWLVIASSIAMVVLAVLGIFMGWPRFVNSLSGWHKGTAWVALPLVILSPLTGIALGLNITFTAPMAPGDRGGGKPNQPVALVDAVRSLGKAHDLSGLIWLRERRGQLLARIVEDGEYRVYAISANGIQATPRNWPRLIHEGNWMGHVSAGVNVITSVALIILFVTGLWIWARRQLRRRRNIAARAAAAAPAAG